MQVSKQLKRLRTLLGDPARSLLYAVTILTDMAFEETKDLAKASERIGLHMPAIFLNLATPESDCLMCSALYRGEARVREKFERTFSGKPHTLVYGMGEPRGLKRLGELGKALYD